jgi:hypothetical protein
MGNISSTLAADLTKQNDQRYYTRSLADSTFVNNTNLQTAINKAIVTSNATLQDTIMNNVKATYKNQADLQTYFDARYATPSTVTSNITTAINALDTKNQGMYATPATVTAAFNALDTKDQGLYALKSSVPTVPPIYTRQEVDDAIAAFRNGLGLPAASPFPTSTQTSLPTV